MRHRIKARLNVEGDDYGNLPETGDGDDDDGDVHDVNQRGARPVCRRCRGAKEAKRRTAAAPGKTLRRIGPDQETARGEGNIPPRTIVRRKAAHLGPQRRALWLRETRRGL